MLDARTRPTSNTQNTSETPKSDRTVENTSHLPEIPEPVSPGQSPLPASATSRLAQELRKRATATTETYVAYGATEQLFKECSRHGHYTIPQALERDGVAPKNEAGEDVGEGSGWWYNSKFHGSGLFHISAESLYYSTTNDGAMQTPPSRLLSTHGLKSPSSTCTC